MVTRWVNGIPESFVSVSDRGFNYGDGLFATMRIECGRIQLLNCHLARLSQGAMRLGFSWQASSELITLLEDIASKLNRACIKLQLSRGQGGRGYAAPESVNVTEVISVSDFPQYYQQWQQQGIKLCRSDIQLGQQSRLAGIKHLNRLEQVLIKSSVLHQLYQDWLVLDCNNNVIESSVANLFIINDKQVITPSIHYSGVAGVMREQVIIALLELGYNVKIADLSISELFAAEHIWLTNSLFGIIDVIQVEQQHKPISLLSAVLRQRLSVQL